MKTERIGTTISLSAIQQQKPAERLKLAFRAFMEVYSKKPVIITGQTRIVVEALDKMVPWLKEELGNSLLAVTLGGSSVRGLNSLESSDVDYYIYSRKFIAQLYTVFVEKEQPFAFSPGFPMS